MSICDDCRATFQVLETSSPEGDRAVRLDRAQPRCRCQATSVSPFSSGVVNYDEFLLRVVVAPQHVNKKKRLPRSAALTDAERNGLSLFRESQATDAEIRHVAEGLVAKARASQGDQAGVFGVLRFLASTARDFIANGESEASYCVYDTGLVDCPSHAEAFQRTDSVDQGLRDQRRNGLFQLLGFIPVQDFRNGLLLDLAPRS